MSKDSTLLEVSKQLKVFVLEFVKNGLDRKFIHGSFDRIEAALEDYELICEMNTQLVKQNNELLSENLKLRKKIKEKEQPMKVELEGNGYADGELVYDTALCPRCGRNFEIEYEENYRYCPDCGQRLDWKIEEIEDE